MERQSQGQLLVSPTSQALSLSPKEASGGDVPQPNPPATSLQNPPSPSPQQMLQGPKKVWESCVGSSSLEGWGLGRIPSSEPPGPSLLHEGQTLTPRSPPRCQTW